MLQGEWVGSGTRLVLVRPMPGSVPDRYGVCEATAHGEDVFGSFYVFPLGPPSSKGTRVVRVEGEDGAYRIGVADRRMSSIKWHDNGEEWHKIQGGTLRLLPKGGKGGKRQINVSWCEGEKTRSLHATTKQARCLFRMPYLPLTILFCVLLKEAVCKVRSICASMAAKDPTAGRSSEQAPSTSSSSSPCLS